MFTGDLDKDFLQHVRGVENNSFINVLHTETDDDNETLDQLQIISHSPWYEDENIISTLSENKNKFNILSTNIQSIRAKFDELKIFIEYLRTLNFSAICTQECCISDNDDLNQVELKGYKLISQDKSSSSKVGLIIYLHEKMKMIINLN